MDTQQESASAGHHGTAGVGEHTHQLLHLVNALTRSAACNDSPGPVADPLTGVTSFTRAEDQPVRASVLGVDLTGLSDKDCVQWAQDLEQLLRVGQALSVHVAGELDTRTRAGRFAETGAKGALNLMTQSLRVSAVEAKRRLKLADHILPVTDTLTGAIAAPAHPELASAVFTGSVSEDQALTISYYLDETQDLIAAQLVAPSSYGEVSSTLLTTAQTEGPDFLREIGHRIISHLDPDGQKPTATELLSKQGIFFRKARRGLVSFYGALTTAQHEQLLATIGFATNPSNTNGSGSIADPSGCEVDPAAQAPRSAPPAAGDANHATTGFAETDDPTPGRTDDCQTTFRGPGPDCAPDSSGGTQNLLPLLGYLSRTPQAAPGTEQASPPAKDPREDALRGPSGPGTAPPRSDVPGLEPIPECQGWRAPLTPEEIPPRPPNAPANAIPPRYPGEKWFWLDPETAAPESGELCCAGPDWNAPFTNGSGIFPDDPVSTMPWLDPIDPSSSDRAVRDTRTHAQKLLDGLLQCVRLAARTDKLPQNGGLKTQLILSCSQEDLQRHNGLVTTMRNGPAPISLFGTELCDPEVTRIVYGEGQIILNAGRTQRFFTTKQRKILFARDLGCSFPDCTAPPIWTEAHHIIPWQEGGPTNIDNSCLLCQFHHTLVHNSDWSIRLINGTPYFTPPLLIDPAQAERRNNYHHAIAPRGNNR